MNFDLTNTNWYKIPNLANDSTYYLQAKIKIYQDDFQEVDILFTQNASYPAEIDDGIYASDIKFKKRAGEDVYIRTLTSPTNIQIEVV